MRSWSRPRGRNWPSSPRRDDDPPQQTHRPHRRAEWLGMPRCVAATTSLAGRTIEHPSGPRLVHSLAIALFTRRERVELVVERQDGTPVGAVKAGCNGMDSVDGGLDLVRARVAALD